MQKNHFSEVFFVILTKDGFSTSTISIPQGGTLNISYKGEGEAWPASDNHPTHAGYPDSDSRKCGTFAAGLALDSCAPITEGRSYRFQFHYSGTWGIHDHLNPENTMTVVVTPVHVYRQPISSFLYTRIHESVVALNSFFDKARNAILVFSAKLQGTVPDDPFLKKYSGSDLITWSSYEKSDVSSVMTSDLEMLRMVHALGIEASIQKVLTYPRYSKNSSQCHEALHIVGRASFALKGFEAFEECTPECFSGCYHGALEASIQNDEDGSLFQNLISHCESRESEFTKEQCFHGLGHAFLLESKYDMHASLASCDRLSESRFVDFCYSGVFMENYTGEPALLGVKNVTAFRKDNIHYPCTIFNESPRAEGWCYKAQPNHFLDVYQGDFQKAADECINAPLSARSACFTRLGQIRGVDSVNPSELTESFCESIPSVYADDCIAGAARFAAVFPGPDAFGESIAFCRNLETHEFKSVCYAEYTKKIIEMFSEGDVRLSLCGFFEVPFNGRCVEEVRGLVSFPR